MAEGYFARPENAAEILAAAAILLAARVRGSVHAGIDCERRRAIDDAINLYGELMQRLSALPDRSAKMDAAALLVAVRTLKPDVDLERDRVEGLARRAPRAGIRLGCLPVVEAQGSPTTSGEP